MSRDPLNIKFSDISNYICSYDPNKWYDPDGPILYNKLIPKPKLFKKTEDLAIR